MSSMSIPCVNAAHPDERLMEGSSHCETGETGGPQVPIGRQIQDSSVRTGPRGCHGCHGFHGCHGPQNGRSEGRERIRWSPRSRPPLLFGVPCREMRLRQCAALPAATLLAYKS